MTENNKNSFYILVGSAIQKARKKANMSQEIVAEKLEMSRASIVNIEKGRQRPPLHLLWSLSKILKMPIHELIPDFQIKNNDIKPGFEKAIKHSTEKGLIQKDSGEKLSKFISRS